MASTYSPLKIELITTGEQSGSWGSTTNVNLGTAIEEAITGSADVTFASANVTLTLTNTNGTQTARNLRLRLTGTTAGARNLIVPAIEKQYIVQNDCADAVTIKNATGTGVAIPPTMSAVVYNDGVNIVSASVYSTSVVTPLLAATDAVFINALPVTSGGTGVTTATGTGSVVRATSPTLTTPALGTPSALVGTNITGTAAGLSIGGNAATATLATTATSATNALACSGNSATATNLTGDQSNWVTNNRNSAVAGQLGWRNYGNGHTIFDASASVSPSGGSVNNTNATNTWTTTYPTLMGWNGAQTYGVRVDSARISDSTSGSSASCTGNSATATLATTATVANNAIGVGQTWQDVIGSRSAGTTYTNSTGKSIMVGIRTQGNAYITVDGVITAYSGINNASNFLGTIVPPGSSYFMTGAVYNWAELR